MNTALRAGLYVVLAIGCVFPAAAEERLKPGQPDYEGFIKPYKAKARLGWFPGPKGGFDRVEVPLKLVVTAIEGDEPQAKGKEDSEQQFNRKCDFGCEVSADWRVYHFFDDSSGHKGSGYWKVPDADQKRLDKLLAKLPDDGARLTPPNRRVVLQVPDGEHSRARVYDRANAPDEVCEILRLSHSGIGSWMPTFKAESDLNVGDDSIDGIFALTPDRQQLVSATHGSLKFWDPITHKLLNDLPLPPHIIPKGIKFSPVGSLAVIMGVGRTNCVVDTKKWKVLRDLREPFIGRYDVGLYFPQFTADGRYLIFICHQPDAKGHYTTLPRAYETKTWKWNDNLPDLPESALTCVQTPKGKRAIVVLKDNTMVLWDLELRREYAKLSAHMRIGEVAFSPDESMAAVATGRNGEHDWRIDSIRVWKMSTGELLHDLRPFEQATCENVVGLQWTADGQYILAATKSGSFDNYDINIWNAKSGRHRGNLSGELFHPIGVVILPDGQHIAAAGENPVGGKVRLWDFAAALMQIQTFEHSLVEPKAGQ